MTFNIDEYVRQVQEAEARVSQQRSDLTHQEMDTRQEQPSTVKEQLDLGPELERIDYLLRGFSIEIDPDTGYSGWKAPKNTDMVILTDYGVHLIRNTIAWYINKNTLLSNYDDKTIYEKMEDFANDLNDTIFMEYEKVFQYPSLEDCKMKLNERIEKKKQLRIYASEIIGSRLDEKEVEQDLWFQIEPIIERELEKIKQQLIKDKLKRFLILVREIQDAVHSTYLRAWKGQERATLRQHTHITETRGGNPIMPDNRGVIGRLISNK